MKPVTAVCTLPLERDCSARGRKVGKWMHQYWIQSVLPSKCNGSFSANIRKKLMEGFPSQLDWTQHEVLPWYTQWTVFNSAFWFPNFVIFGMKRGIKEILGFALFYQLMGLLKKKKCWGSTSFSQTKHNPGKRHKQIIIVLGTYFILRIFVVFISWKWRHRKKLND